MRVFLLCFQYMTAAAAAAPMQGTYIPQYTAVPPTAVSVEVRATPIHTWLEFLKKSIDMMTSSPPAAHNYTHTGVCLYKSDGPSSTNKANKKKTVRVSGKVWSLTEFGKDVWSAAKSLPELLAGFFWSSAAWEMMNVGDRRARRRGQSGLLSAGWRCSRIQTDYQSCIRWQQLKWDTVPTASHTHTHRRLKMVGSWNTHICQPRSYGPPPTSYTQWQFPLTEPLVAAVPLPCLPPASLASSPLSLFLRKLQSSSWWRSETEEKDVAVVVWPPAPLNRFILVLRGPVSGSVSRAVSAGLMYGQGAVSLRAC